MIFITGATGGFAGTVIQDALTLIPAGERLVVGTRNPESQAARKIASTHGIDVRRVDFDAPATLATAFSGVTKVLIVPTTASNDVRFTQNSNAIRAAQAAGVRHVIYASFINAGATSLIEHNQKVHGPTERFLRESGLTYTILRHGLYAEIILGDLEQTLASGRFRRGGDDMPTALISRRDLARSAASVLTHDGHENRIYTETAPQAVRNSEIASIIAEVFGKPVVHENLSEAEWVEYAHAVLGMPRELALSSVGTMRAIAGGEFNVVTDDYHSITGRPARSVRQFLQDFRQSKTG